MFQFKFKFIWIISGLHVNNKRINNNIHTKIVMALTSCDNTVITIRWKKREQTHHIKCNNIMKKFAIQHFRFMLLQKVVNNFILKEITYSFPLRIYR